MAFAEDLRSKRLSYTIFFNQTANRIQPTKMKKLSIQSPTPNQIQTSIQASLIFYSGQYLQIGRNWLKYVGLEEPTISVSSF